MAELRIEIPDELEREMGKLPENWSEIALEAIKLRILRRKLGSEKEKELTNWSVELGRKANKSAFKRLLSELSPEERKKIFG